MWVLAAAGLLAWPAVYNGYPLLDPDSGQHLAAALEGWIFWARSIGYSLVLVPVHLGTSQWPIPFAQSALLAHFVFLAQRAVVGRVRPAAYLALCAGLAAFTALPWHASHVMPDIFAATLCLGFGLLGLGWERLGHLERAWVFAWTAVSAAVHYGHVPLAWALAGAVLAVRALACGPHGSRLSSARALLVAVGPALVGTALVVGTHVVYSGRPALAPYSGVFLLARLVDDGPAREYLEESCPEAGFVLCEDLGRLGWSSDEFLWSLDGPVRRRGPEVVRNEAWAIVTGTCRRTPGWCLALFARNSLRQFTALGTGHAIFPLREDEHPYVTEPIAHHVPRDVTAFRAARQYQDRLPMAAVRRVHRVCLALAGLAAVVLALEGWRRDRAVFWIAAFVLSALVANAAVMGGLSRPAHRYQTRVAWLVPLYVGLCVLRRTERGRPGEATPVAGRAIGGEPARR